MRTLRTIRYALTLRLSNRTEADWIKQLHLTGLMLDVIDRKVSRAEVEELQHSARQRGDASMACTYGTILEKFDLIPERGLRRFMMHQNDLAVYALGL